MDAIIRTGLNKNGTPQEAPAAFKQENIPKSVHPIKSFEVKYTVSATMGSSQSVRATHFQRQIKESPPEPEPDEPDEHHISITNKMVERLVEDATLAAGGAAKAGLSGTPRGDFKDKIYTEKLRSLDETHSEKLGLTAEDISSMTKRIELRTENMVNLEPVCPDCKQNVIDCYNLSTAHDVVRCWDTVGEFGRCVREARAVRLAARGAREQRAAARRERHVARARDTAFRDLTAPPHT